MRGTLDEHRGELRAALTRSGLTLIILAAAVLGAQADDRDPKKLDPEQVRKDMAKVKARLDLERKKLGVAPAPNATARDQRAGNSPRNAEKSSRSRSEVPAPARAAQALSYRFVRGQTFGYTIDILIKRTYKSERFAGRPIFSVKSVDDQGNALVFVIGKLTCTSLLTGSEEELERPNRTVWIGSLLKVSPWGQVGGKDDYKKTVLPVFLTTLIKPRELFFPELTASINGERSEQGKSTLWLQMSSGSTFSVLPNTKQIEGIQKRVLRARAVTDSLVEIRKERSFRGKDSPPTTLSYRSTSRIDLSRGLMVDSAGVSDTEEGPVTIRIKLLEGDELKAAVDQANADWVDRPEELDPVELRRVRVNLDSPRRLKSPAEAKPGMAVAHYRDGDHRWYLAQVVEVTDARRYQVKIRYRGSDEIVDAHVGQLAIPPASAGGPASSR